ncbi:MAG: glycosyltransferase family 4 protein [Gammaproteobacteria bacterium]|nr:glycosyltransferase family 4 protein [Gammaproteobacteria bacterium]
MKKIIALTQGRNIPSTRFRISQYADGWQQAGYAFEQLNAKVSAYPPVGLFKRLLWIVGELVHRVRQVKVINSADVVVIQRELISTLYTVEACIKAPVVLDVDDAIFLYKSGKAAKALALKANHIVCGNQFLAHYFSQYNENISIIPTAVDTNRFKPSVVKPAFLCMGWSGSSSGFDYLYAIEAELKEVLDKKTEWKLSIVSDKAPDFKVLKPDQWTFTQWTPDNEVATIQDMSIGLMPLADNEWTRGKCSYKMLLYMACGVPVVVSDVGMNSEILSVSKVGVGVNNKSSWLGSLSQMMDDEVLRAECGQRGRQLAEKEYSLTACNQKWLSVLSRVSSAVKK